MKIVGYGCYTIQSALGAPGQDCYLHVPMAGIDAGRAMAMWGYDARGVDFTDHFEFVLIPTPGLDDTYSVVNRRSGLPLRVRGERVVQGAAPGCSAEEASDQAAEFVFEPVDGEYRIVSQLTGRYLAPRGFKTANGTELVLVDPVLPSGTDDRVRRFRLTQVAGLMGKVPEPADNPGARFARLKSLDTDLPDQTSPVLREIEVVPFLAVNDPVYPVHRQVQVSPYYTLQMSTLWSKLLDRQLDGIVERETEESSETGLTTLDAESVMSTFSWSVSAEASVGYNKFGFSGSLKLASKLAGETKRTTHSSSEHREQHVFTETIHYPAIGRPYRLVRWRPVDRYELRRKDGSLVHSWDVVRTEQEVIDVFPRTVKVPAPAMSDRASDRTARARARREVAVGA